MKELLDGRRIGVVVAHAAHLLTVAGLVQRVRPHILVCNSAPGSKAGNQAKLIRSGLELAGIGELTTFLDRDEPKGYASAHEGRWEYFLETRALIHDWICETDPEVVFGDAFECSNYHHDVVRLLLDESLRSRRAGGRRLENLEFPLACRTERQPDTVQFQTFASEDGVQRLQLTQEQVEGKERVARWAMPRNDLIAAIAPLIPEVDQEPFREVPADRDYRQVPKGLLRHYDLRGPEVVAQGLHERPISFEQHFVPLVEACRAHPIVAGAERATLPA